MTAIVMNTRSGAVTEYGESFAFVGLTPTHAANASGLFTVGGETDDGTDIAASFRGPYQGGEAVLSVDSVHIGIRGDEGALQGYARVLAGGKTVARGTEWQYPVYVQRSGISRAVLGKGIRENSLAFGYTNVDGAAFTIRSMMVELGGSKNRKAG